MDNSNFLSIMRNDIDYMNRKAKWDIFWLAYRGVFWNRLTNKYEEDIAVNNLRKVVTTTLWFLFGETGVKPIFLDESKKYQKDVDLVFQYNNFAGICYDIGSNTSIYGDCYIKIGFEEMEENNPFLKRYGIKNGQVKITVLNPSNVYPRVNDFDKETVDFFVVEFTDLRGEYMTEVHYKDRVEVYRNDHIVMTVPNPTGEFLITHIPNIRNTKSYFGLSDFDDIFTLNKEIIAKMRDLSEIIDYHGSPVTLMFGVKRQDLVRSAKRVWSGLPKDSRVENLSMETDLEAINTFIRDLDNKVWELADIPEIARGKSLSISNTSSAAMKMLYYPLIQKAGRKKILMSPAIEEVIWKILLILDAKGVLELSDTPKFKLSYPSPFPVDEVNTMTLIEHKKALGMITKRMALEALGENQDNIDDIISLLGEDFPVEVELPKDEKKIGNESFYSELKQDSEKILESQSAQENKTSIDNK
ncbi:MAG: phage portal protein [Methanogenium sp.]|jgi:hypothetical protein